MYSAFVFAFCILHKRKLCGSAWVDSNTSKTLMFAGSPGSMAISSQSKVVATVAVFFLVVVALVVADVVIAFDRGFLPVTAHLLCQFVFFFVLCFACVHKCIHFHGVQYQMLACK